MNANEALAIHAIPCKHEDILVGPPRVSDPFHCAHCGIEMEQVGEEWRPVARLTETGHQLSDECWCRPYRDTQDNRIVIHREAARA